MLDLMQFKEEVLFRIICMLVATNTMQVEIRTVP
jgi:hypothetical protein